MAIPSQSNTVVIPAPLLSSQPWWIELHSMINESYRAKDVHAFPPTWGRLNSDPALGAEGLSRELGPEGHLAIVFTDNRPVACGGILPFRGENWIDKVGDSGEINITEPSTSGRGSASPSDLEICCFCVHPSFRRNGMSAKILDTLTAFAKGNGASRLFSAYSIEETGDFWPKVGFETIPGAGGILKKGFKLDLEKEGLRADLHLRMGVKQL